MSTAIKKDTDAEIYSQYNTEAFFAAIMRNKQLKSAKKDEVTN